LARSSSCWWSCGLQHFGCYWWTRERFWKFGGCSEHGPTNPPLANCFGYCHRLVCHRHDNVDVAFDLRHPHWPVTCPSSVAGVFTLRQPTSLGQGPTSCSAAVAVSYALALFKATIHMDFIERYLGISHGGDQPLEVLLLVALVTFIAVVGLRLLGIGKTKDGVRKKTRNRFFRGL
jgi:hypothetical protein